MVSSEGNIFIGYDQKNGSQSQDRQEQEKVCKVLWEMFVKKVSSEAMRESLQQSEPFLKLSPEAREHINHFITVMDANLPASERIQAAMKLTEKSSKDDLGAERFLSKMFAGVTSDGNLDNDRDKIKAIEKALNGLEVNGIKLNVSVDGVADGRLAGLLRTPEVIAALKQAVDSGVVTDVKFNEKFEFSADNIRLNNIDRPQQQAQDRGASR